MVQKNIQKIVASEGWYIIHIPAQATIPAFTYTIGLYYNFQHPELFVFGLNELEARHLLNEMAISVRLQQQFKLAQVYNNLPSTTKIQLVPIAKHNISHYFGYALWFYDYAFFPCWQIIWADNQGCFPWEEAYDKRLYLAQAMLDRNHKFAFFEQPNRGVYTTKQVIEQQYPILYVLHDTAGDWQFLCGTTINPNDFRLVSLVDIVQFDNSLNALFDLPIGAKALRTAVTHNWIRNQL